MNDSIVYIITNKLLLLLTHLFIFLRFSKLHNNLINLSLLPPCNLLIDFLLLAPAVDPSRDPDTADEEPEHETHNEDEHDEHLKRGHVPDAVHLSRRERTVYALERVLVAAQIPAATSLRAFFISGASTLF
jgi:hypothetical protein